MKRLNLKLVIGLLVTLAVTCGGTYLLHAFQLDRNAGSLLELAKQAEQEGDNATAIKRYSQYLQYRSDPEAAKALSKLLFQKVLSADPGTMSRVFGEASGVMEKALREHPDLKEVRRTLAEMYLLTGHPPIVKEALAHLEKLRKADPKDVQVLLKTAQCQIMLAQEDQAFRSLSELVGYNQETREFDVKKAKAAQEVGPYDLLARLMLQRRQEELADKVMEQLVAANPKSARALAARGGYSATFRNDTAKAEADLDAALQLAPDDPEIISSWAVVKSTAGKGAEAVALVEEALKKNSDKLGMHLLRAMLLADQRKYPQAKAACEEGLTKHPNNLQLLVLQAKVNEDSGDAEGMKKTLEVMRTKVKNVPPFLLRYHEACLLLMNGQWREAADALEQVRKLVVGNRNYTAETNVRLAQCYERLGQPDRQVEASRRALDANPALTKAIVYMAAGLERQGKHAEARKLRAPLGEKMVKEGKGLPVPLLADSLNQAIAEQRALPQEKRDWSKVDELLEQAMSSTAPEMSPARRTLFAVQVMVAKGELDKANIELDLALKRDPKNLALWTARISVVEQLPGTPKERVKAGMQIVRNAEEAVGDCLAIRQLKAGMIMLGATDADPKVREQAAAALAKLETGLENFSNDDRFTLIAELGLVYFRSRDYDNGRRCWLQVAQEQPNNFQIRKSLFEMSRDFGKLDDMRADVEAVKKVLGEGDAMYKLIRASSLLKQIRLRKLDRAQLAEARRVLDEVAAERPNWHEVFELLGELNDLEGKSAEALANYRRALEYGPADPLITQRVAELEFRRGNLAGFEETLGQIKPGKRSQRIEEMVTEGMIRKGDTENALKRAQEAVEKSPESAQAHMLYGRTLEMAGKPEAAEMEFRLAIEKDSKSAPGYLTLIYHLVRQKKRADARDVMAEAENNLEQNEISLVLGQGHEMLGENGEAEKHYLALQKAFPDNLMLTRTLVIFYTRNGQAAAQRAVAARAARQDAEAQAREEESARLAALAAKQLDELVAKKLPAGDANLEHVAWARREQAQRVAAAGSYASLLKALALVDQNAVGGKPSADDLHVKGTLLAGRPDKISREQALAVFEQLAVQHMLTLDEQYTVVRLHLAAGRWGAARDQMAKLVASSKNDPRYALMFATMLVEHGEIDAAQGYLTRLEPVAGTSPPVLALKARVFAKQGKTAELKSAIQGLLGAKITKDDLPRMVSLANLLDELGQQAAAEKLLRDYVKSEAGSRGALALAEFLGGKGNVDEAFELCAKAINSQPTTEVVRVALNIARAHGRELRAPHVAKVEEWINLGVENNPRQAVTLKLMLAELRDLAGQTEQAAKIYRELLASGKLTELEAANARNNLAFALALLPDAQANSAEALKLVEQAEAYHGKLSDLLDTRGMVYLGAGDLNRAAEDLKSAAEDSPTGVKYFHLALAYQRKGELVAAKDALAKAREQKVDGSAMAPLERKLFDELSAKLKSR